MLSKQCDDRKARTLAAYDAIARCGVAGPKIVVREELEQMDRKCCASQLHNQTQSQSPSSN